MTTLLLDSHVLLWWSSSADQLSATAVQAIQAADGLAVSSVTWYELAWLAVNGRITLQQPVRQWLDGLALGMETISLTPRIAATAAELPERFPGDPSDRIIYATAIEEGVQLVTKDERLRRHPYSRQVTVW